MFSFKPFCSIPFINRGCNLFLHVAIITVLYMASEYIWSSPFIRGSSMACYLLQKAIENGPVEIVDLPIGKMVIFHSYVKVYQRVHVASLAIACDLSCTCQCAFYHLRFGSWPEGGISTSQAWLELTEFRINGDCNGISLEPGHGSKMCATKRSSRPNLDRWLTWDSWQVCFLWHLGWGHLWT